eukprot:scaffold8_cov249-Pinguiococcus_pyrenoidosus.AAC.15
MPIFSPSRLSMKSFLSEDVRCAQSFAPSLLRSLTFLALLAPLGATFAGPDMGALTWSTFSPSPTANGKLALSERVVMQLTRLPGDAPVPLSSPSFPTPPRGRAKRLTRVSWISQDGVADDTADDDLPRPAGLCKLDYLISQSATYGDEEPEEGEAAAAAAAAGEDAEGGIDGEANGDVEAGEDHTAEGGVEGDELAAEGDRDPPELEEHEQPDDEGDFFEGDEPEFESMPMQGWTYMNWRHHGVPGEGVFYPAANVATLRFGTTRFTCARCEVMLADSLLLFLQGKPAGGMKVVTYRILDEDAMAVCVVHHDVLAMDPPSVQLGHMYRLAPPSEAARNWRDEDVIAALENHAL